MKFETLIYILLVIASSVLIVSGFKDSIGKSFERRDRGMCEVWKTEAELYPNYFITEWQKSQCDSYDINIDTFVID